MSPENVGVCVAELTLLLAPIAAAVAVASAQNSPLVLRRLWIGVGCYLGVFAAAWVCAIETASSLVNFVVSVSVYAAYSLLVALCLTLRLRVTRLVFGVAGLVSLLPGYLLATVGLLGLFFIVGDEVRSPLQAVVLRPGLYCRITQWGFAASDEGYDVHLYRYWPALPLLQRQVARVTVNETHPVNGLVKASCEGIARARDQGRL